MSKIPSNDELNYTVDVILNDKTFNQNLVLSVGNLHEVWGNGLEEPLFAIENIKIPTSEIKLMGANRNTIKFKYKDVDFMKFKTSEELYDQMVKEDYLNITAIGKFKLNSFNGKVSGQVLMEDFKFEKCEQVNSFRF